MVGVLALQGDVREHADAVEAIGATWKPVRRPEDLQGIDALIIPGGESTTIGKLAEIYGLIDPLRAAISDGLPTLGTCAGMILLGAAVTDGAQTQLGVLDVIIERNAFGRQNESFEANLDVAGLDQPFWAVFIRAPWVVKVGGGVEVVAMVDEHPVMVRQGNILAVSFHPELTGDRRIHTMLLQLAENRRRSDGEH
ncbi:MAG: pyridoxal 5'-phosphate synthase glutaminase subunit PdxT [Acidimicrobiia bacterium]